MTGNHSLRRSDLALVRCPRCRSRLTLVGSGADDAIEGGLLECDGCPGTWPVEDGIADLVDLERVPATDFALRPIYALVAPTHDLGASLVLPVFQGTSDGALRGELVRLLELDGELARGGRPLRILEVGFGAGANLPYLEDVLGDVDVELWVLDLSREMLVRSRRRTPRSPRWRIVPILADAHTLPLASGVFDRVFHVGAANSFGDPRKAIAELARCSRPGVPILVSDERLDPDRRHSIVHRLAFRWLTFFDSRTDAPLEFLPPGAEEIAVHQVSRFYYVLTFRMAPTPKRLEQRRSIGPEDEIEEP